MRPAATSLFLTAEAVCWELPLGCPWGSPLAHRACWCVAGHISISLPDPCGVCVSSSTLPGGSRLAWES